MRRTRTRSLSRLTTRRRRRRGSRHRGKRSGLRGIAAEPLLPMSRRLVLVLAAAGAGQAAQYLARPMTSYRLLALGAGPREVGYVAATFAVVPVFLAIPLGRFA